MLGKKATPSPFQPLSLKLANLLVTQMGRTIPSFRIAAEMERARWRDFRLLLNLKDRKTFDQMFFYVRLYNSACMMQANPDVFHSVTVSILSHHYKQLMKLTDVKKNDELQVIDVPEMQRVSTLDVYCLSTDDKSGNLINN
jgi:hypothetical protein